MNAPLSDATLSHRRATAADAVLLGELNHQLIQDEGHRNPMTVPQLQQRMRDWLEGDYNAVLFEQDGQVAAYALYREQAGLIYLRQLFVQRDRRRRGIGGKALQMLRTRFWPAATRLTVEVLSANTAAIALYKAAGFCDYSVTLEMVPSPA